MKTTILFIAALLLSVTGFSQYKNFIDQPYFETSVKVDTLVVPDKIYLSILITEADTRGKITVEELENKMAGELKSIGIDLKKQLLLSDVSSNFKKYFLKKQDILKAKSYSLIVYNAKTAGMAMLALENIGISNVELEKTEYSKREQMLLDLKIKAVEKAKYQADSMVRPLQQKIGKAILITDVNTMYSDMAYAKAGGIRMAYSEMARDSYQPIEIEFEKIKIECEVQIKFALE